MEMAVRVHWTTEGAFGEESWNWAVGLSFICSTRGSNVALAVPQSGSFKPRETQVCTGNLTLFINPSGSDWINDTLVSESLFIQQHFGDAFICKLTLSILFTKCNDVKRLNMIRRLKYASKIFFQIVNYCRETSSKFSLYNRFEKVILCKYVFCDEKLYLLQRHCIFPKFDSLQNIYIKSNLDVNSIYCI